MYIIPFASDNTLLCDSIYKPAKNITVDMYYRRNISSRFSGNSEAKASELPENLEEIL